LKSKRHLIKGNKVALDKNIHEKEKGTKMGKEKAEKAEKKNIAVAVKNRINPRGRIFEGIVIKKFTKRIVIEFERRIYIRKYERYLKSKTKIHARLPDDMIEEINVGDLIRVQECRPLSKIIHFVVIQKIKDKEEKGK